MNDLPSATHAPRRDGKDLLRQSIAEVLRLIREDLVMDMVLITIHAGDNVTVSRRPFPADGRGGEKGVCNAKGSRRVVTAS